MKAYDELYVVLIMLCTGRDWDRIAIALRGWSTKAWRHLFQACSPKEDARLVVLTMVVVAILLDMKNAGVNLDVGCIEMASIYLNALDVDAFTKGSKGASKDSGEKHDSEFVCWCCEKQQ